MDVGFCMQAFSHPSEELRKPGFLLSTGLLSDGIGRLSAAATGRLLRASFLVMNLGSNQGKRYWLVAWVLSILALIAACGTISPRRVVINNPSPTPTVSPSITPTPTPFPTATVTPTPTPTPTAMAAVVPSQFLFTADPWAGVILGFKINPDGGLSPVPGSPFVADDSGRWVAGLDGSLLVAGKSSLMAFAVNKETGAIRKSDSVKLSGVSSLIAEPVSHIVFASTASGRVAVRMVNDRLHVSAAVDVAVPVADSSTSVADASGKFIYQLDPQTGVISAFSLEGGKTAPLSPGSYPAGHSNASLAIVKR
jgi:hypothetical protein